MSPTITFFGSGPVAAASLRLLAQECTIEAVVTKPRPAHHRGAVPVVSLAEELGIPLLYAANKSELDAVFATKPVQSKLAVLIDFGIIISKAVIDYFPLGIINSHFSILPELRGADPISFAILSGQATTGVSLMLVAEGMDTGNVLDSANYVLPADITTPVLTDELIQLSHQLLVPAIKKQFVEPSLGRPQSESGHQISYTRKLTKADSQLDWQKPAVQLEREIRAYQDWPRSRAMLGSVPVIINTAHSIAGNGEPGTLWRDARSLGVYTADGILVVDQLTPVGKKTMPTRAFLAGYQL